MVATIGVVCEGVGDVDALRVLLPRIVGTGGLPLQIGTIRRSAGRGNITARGGLERFIRFVADDHDALLVVADSDRDCPVTLARGLAERARMLQLAVPTAVVLAHHAFEAWFLADLESIVERRVRGRVLIPGPVEPVADPDAVRNPKRTLDALTAAGESYRESRDQPSLASMIDLDAVFAGSRSFRRLVGALSQLGEAVDAGRADVTP